jgi:hypothetical protein
VAADIDSTRDRIGCSCCRPLFTVAHGTTPRRPSTIMISAKKTELVLSRLCTHQAPGAASASVGALFMKPRTTQTPPRLFLV